VNTKGTRKLKTAKSIAGSGNVFADIGFDNADEMLARSGLVRAAKLLGINQPKVSALNCGRITEFSIDRLMRFLVALGQEVDIRVRPGSSAAGGCW
jgi:predicted XRE-type DNA-binding protein